MLRLILFYYYAWFNFEALLFFLTMAFILNPTNLIWTCFSAWSVSCLEREWKKMSFDLTEASQRVAVLESFPFENDEPEIEAPSLSLLYDGHVDYNFADRGAFETKWSEECHSIAQLVSLNFFSLHLLLKSERGNTTRKFLHQHVIHLSVVLKSAATGKKGHCIRILDTN